MILSVTPNPALDRVHVTRGFQPGEQSRALLTFLQPGGSGVHASQIVQTLGGQAFSLGLFGGQTGALWRREAEQRGLLFEMVPVEGETRESFCLVDLDKGSQVEAVEAGPQVEPGSLEQLLVHLQKRCSQAEMLILSGSLPPGLPPDSYARMIHLASQAGVRTILDTYSEPLLQALPSRPWMIKPNLAEFHRLIGRETTCLVERAEASQELARRQGLVVALSMAEEGLLLSTPEEQWRLLPPEERMYLPGGSGQSVIGCGDALVGAFAREFCRSGNLLAAARWGLAAAHQNLGTLGVPQVDPEQVRRLAASVRVAPQTFPNN